MPPDHSRADATPRRLATLDVIRGVAVMGILVMNIVAFAMPEAAYMNPAAFGGHTGIDLAIWTVDFILIDGKMRGLFSFLFGASMLLVIDRATARRENPARVHFSRMFWLFLFGEAHMILLWWGDILHHYALMGGVAYFFRDKPPYKLVGIAIVLLLTEMAMIASMTMSIHATVAAVQAPHPSTETVEQYQTLRRGFGVPTPDELAKDMALHRGPYAPLVEHRLGEAVSTTTRTLTSVGLETLGYMLLGMACLKSGMLTGAWDRRRYLCWIIIGFGVGIPASAVLAWYVAAQGFAMVPLVLGVLALPTLFRPLMIIGWACLIVLLARSGGAIAERFGAAGRMAFSNYLGTSLICSTLFYGYGFGLYDHVSRAGLSLVVVAIWVLMLLWSKPWLAHFRFGPLEWVWRSLARLHFQPMRGAASAD